LESSIQITPKPSHLRYQHDVFGNCIGVARFAGKTRELVFESLNRLEHTPEHSLDQTEWRDRGINAYPFAYDSTDLPDVYSSMLRTYQYTGRTLDEWARRFLQKLPKVDAIHVLTAMGQAIHAEFKYLTRLAGPPQHPEETLRLGSGTCRDFAVLMMEAARSLGLATRFVSGYLFIPPSRDEKTARLGGGHTHAWVRVFLPNGGWMEFDPTNGLVGNRDLIRVAVVRDPVQAIPLSGTWEGQQGDFLGMDVKVSVTAEKLGERRLPIQKEAGHAH
jgi:transglutaminase-like putative cysteine protease